MSTKLAATPIETLASPHTRRPSTRVRVAFPALALAILTLILAGCLGPEQSSSIPADAAPQEVDPNSTAAALILDPETAREYQRNGQYEHAAAILRAIVEREQGSAQHDARLSLGRIYLRLAYDDRAREQFQLYIEGAPSGADLKTGQFLLARALARLGDAQRALELYGRYVDGGGFASPYARLARAQLFTSLGQHQEAAREAEAALVGVLPTSFRLSLLLTVAQAHEEAGDSAEAARWYRLLSDESPFPADKALALWRLGSLKRASDDPAWRNDFYLTISTYPETSAAEGALAELLEAGEFVDPYSEGLVYYRNFRNEEAQQAFSDYLAQEPAGPQAAAATFYLAATEERLAEPLAALSHYQDSLRLDPSGPLADDALWWPGRILEQLSRLDEASTAYQSLALRFPASQSAPEAAFRLGLVLYRQGRPAEAADAWTDSTAHPLEPRTRFWLGKAHLAVGATDLAHSELEALAAHQPDDYYSLRAAALLSGDDGFDAEPSANGLDLPEQDPNIDWAEADAWIAPFAPPPLSLSRLFILLPDQRWLRGLELLALGLPTDATLEFRTVLDSYDDQPFALYRLARALHSLSLTHLAAEAAARLLDGMPADTAGEAPHTVLRLAYPADYASLIESTAQSEQISPLLLLAMIRQESFFDPDAGSPAGALGLTQIIPATGRDIASSLGHTDFEADDLYRPSVSIPFGAHYLSRQLSAFDGNLYHALAAYNAGPGNAARWRDSLGDDTDLFLESIEFEETHGYVTRVVENLARYRQLYQAP